MGRARLGRVRMVRGVLSGGVPVCLGIGPSYVAVAWWMLQVWGGFGWGGGVSARVWGRFGGGGCRTLLPCVLGLRAGELGVSSSLASQWSRSSGGGFGGPSQLLQPTSLPWTRLGNPIPPPPPKREGGRKFQTTRSPAPLLHGESKQNRGTALHNGHQATSPHPPLCTAHLFDAPAPSVPRGARFLLGAALGVPSPQCCRVDGPTEPSRSHSFCGLPVLPASGVARRLVWRNASGITELWAGLGLRSVLSTSGVHSRELELEGQPGLRLAGTDEPGPDGQDRLSLVRSPTWSAQVELDNVLWAVALALWAPLEGAARPPDMQGV